MYYQSRSKNKSKTSGTAPINVSERFCIEVQAALQSLMDDADKTEVTFPSSYDTSQRHYIHLMADKYGLFSKSTGGKRKRFVHVAKVKRNAAMENISLRLGAVPLSSANTVWFPPVIKQYMERYPAADGGVDVYSAKDLGPLAWTPQHNAKRNSSPLFKPLRKDSNPMEPIKPRTLSNQTAKLPVYNYRDQFLELVEKNQVVVLSGDTGCGKSTQIPQFLLDDALMRGRGEMTRIICTQPRRLSAISLSERVARERVGQTGREVGHAIRFDSSFDSKRTKLIFCTTGTLLKWLNSDPFAQGFSHLILDEVHERDQFTDFLLILIKTSILKHRPDLKVILMSATIQVDTFAEYFKPTFSAPVLKMTGGTNFPVTTLFLEDILALLQRARTSSFPIMTDSHVNRNGRSVSTRNKRLDCPLCGGTGFASEVEFGRHVANCNGERSVNLSRPSSNPEREMPSPAVPVAAMGDVLQAALNGINAEAKAAMLASYTQQQDALRQDRAVDYDLLVQLIHFINRTFPLNDKGIGAILVFLPGWEEISFMERALYDSSETYEIVLLHSRLSAEEQRRAFRSPPRGKRKLVLATNIAETSLTIEDVVFVVDCGKSKQTHVLAATSSSSFVMGLQTTWVARANCVQRTGRAGRVRAGVCFRLFSKSRFETGMKDFMPPELLTTPLEELLLQIKLLQLESKLDVRNAKAFLLEAMNPPTEASIDVSLQRLKDMGALGPTKSDKEALTLLGWQMSRICSCGVSVQMARVLVWGHFFGCFDAILQTTCTLSGYRDPFLSFLGMSPEEHRRVNDAKKAFALKGSEFYMQSDHFVLWKAFEAYLDPQVQSSWRSKEHFCARHQLHRQTVDQMVSIYKQLQHELGLMGLSIPTQLVHIHTGTSTTIESIASYLMTLSIGLYPNALFSYGPNWKTKEKVKVRLDNSIVTWPAPYEQKRSQGNDELGWRTMEWLVFHEMMQSGRVRAAKYGTKLPSRILQALLMGSVETQSIEKQKPTYRRDELVADNKWLLVLDDWIVYELRSETEARWVALLRKRLHAAFMRHLLRLHGTYESHGENADFLEAQLRQHDAELLQALVEWVSSDLSRTCCEWKRRRRE